MLRTPPDVLITTPESLYLMLTSRAREFLVDAEAVIVDEIHAVARTKRGAHLALTLERLEELAERPLQRIALSATQRPLEEVGRFVVGPGRECTVIDTGMRKPLDLEIHVPVEDMREPDAHDVTDRRRRHGHRGGGGDLVGRAWARRHDRDVALDLAGDLPRAARALSSEHRSTIVFVNNRRGAERLALRLNELAAEESDSDGGEPHDIARAHHGSLAREERLVVEDLLKSGAAALPRRDLVARARHRHGRRRPGDPGRVAEVGHRRAPADRPRRPRRRRGRRGGASSRSSAPTCSSARWSPSACATARSSRRSCRATRSTCSRSRSSRWRPPATN